jgi:hypothetical protein
LADVTTERLQLELAVKGQESADRLASEIDKVTAAGEKLRDARGRFVAAEERAATATDASTAAMGRGAAAAGKLDAATGKAGSKVAGFGQTALQTGRVVQDFAQGGLGGILNNIEGLTVALGLGSGLAGVLTIVGVGFEVFKPQIKSFLESFNAGAIRTFATDLDRLNEQVKEIEARPVKLAVDARDLSLARQQVVQIQAAMAALEAMRGALSTGQQKAATAVRDALVEAPGGFAGVEADLRKRMQPGALAAVTARFTPEIERVRKAMEKAQADAMADPTLVPVAARFEKELEGLQEARNAAINHVLNPEKEGGLSKQIGELIGRATAGGQRQPEGIRDLAAALRRAGRGELAGQVAGQAPEALRAAAEKTKAAKEAKEADEFDAAALKTYAELTKQEAAEAIRQSAAIEKDTKDAAAQKAREARAAFFLGQGFSLPPVRKGPKAPDEAKLRQADEEQRQERLATQIFAGGQRGFTPDQSRDIAADSIKMQRQGLDVNEATNVAMGKALQVMQQLSIEMQRQRAWSLGMGREFEQLLRANDSNQHSALNVGR